MPGVWGQPPVRLPDRVEGVCRWSFSCYRRLRLSSPPQAWGCFHARGMKIAADRVAKSQERGNVAKAHGEWLSGDFLFCFLESYALRRHRPT